MHVHIHTFSHACLPVGMASRPHGRRPWRKPFVRLSRALGPGVRQVRTAKFAMGDVKKPWALKGIAFWDIL